MAEGLVCYLNIHFSRITNTGIFLEYIYSIMILNRVYVILNITLLRVVYSPKKF